MLGLPSAQGLFHKAIVQSGPGLRGVTGNAATAVAEQLLAAVGLKRHEARKLQHVPAEQLIAALATLPEAGPGRAGAMALRPVVEGRYLPAHPFDPVAAPSAANVPLIIGTNRDEQALFAGLNPERDVRDETALDAALRPMLGERMDQLLATYRRTRPGASARELFIAISSDEMRVGSIRLAERKAAGGPAPAYMYRFDFESDFRDGRFKAGHAVEIAYVFDHVDRVPLAGKRPGRYELAAAMSDAWIAFARTGNPNHEGLPAWPVYSDGRATMIFDNPCRAECDPNGEERLAWEGIPVRRG